MRTNVLNDLSSVVKKGTGLACSWSQVGRMSEGAPDEHPMSIRSASDGERWKPAGEKGSSRVWKHVAMIFAVLVMSIANIGMAWGVDITVTRFALNGTTIYAINESNKMFHDEVEFSLSTTPSLSSNKLSVPASSVLTIGAHGKTITKIVIEWNTANNSSTFSTGTATWKNSNKTMTWTGSTTSLAITSGAASRVNSAVITYTDADPLSGVTTTTLSSFSRIYSSSGACMYSSKTNSAYGVNIQGALDSNNPVGLSKNASNSLFTNGLRLVSPKPISSVVYTWTVAPTAASVSSGTYNSSTSTWTAANTTTTEVTIYNNGTGTAKFSQIVVNFVGSTPSCTSITPTWSTDYSSTTLNVGATSSTPVVGKDGSSGAVTFSSSDTYIATVNSSGVVTGVGAGTATITATVAADGGKCEGTVTKSFTIKAGITYNANGADGGSVPTDASTYAYNANITVAGNTGSLYKTGFVFNGWNTRSDGTGTHYEAGATMKMPSKSAGVTLYAEWVGYATSWEWWNCGQSNNSTTFTYITSKNYICSFASSASTAVASWDMSGGEYYRGIKIKTKDHSIAFWVQTGKRVSITFGTRPTKPTFTVGGVDKSSEVGASTNSDSITVTYTTTADTKFYIENETATNTAFTVKSVKIEDAAPSCTAPSSVSVDATNTNGWRYSIGETIDLTCTASGGSGGSYTYQWQKYIGSSWEDIDGATNARFQKASCTSSDGGQYRCVVSTGATCSLASDGFNVRVWTLNGNYSGSGFTENAITWTGANTGTATVTLNANSTYEFKVYGNGDGKYYGCNSGISSDISDWTFRTNEGNCALTTGALGGGEYTFAINISNAGENNITVSVTYPRKTIYVLPNGYTTASAKLSIYYWRGGTNGWSSFLSSDECGAYSTNIPGWAETFSIVRLNSDATAGSWDKKWNQTVDITANASYNQYEVNTWCSGDGCKESVTAGTYSIPTYTISYNAGTGGSGSKASESKTCGVAFTLPNSAVFTRTGYTQTGWTTSDGGSQTHALGGSYTTNAAQTFYPVWTVNNYDLTWDLAGGTTTSAGTGIGSGVSSNTTTSQAFGTALTAPTVTKTGYNFSAWSPTVAGTMPAANTTYTATWTVKTTTITINANTANHGSTAPSPITATYGSALPSFTAAAGESGYSLTGYFTTATSGTKVINADGTLVASTDYADGDGKWKYETASLTLYPQYEEEAGEDCTNEYNSPSTTTYATKTFLDVSATNYNTSASTNYYLTYSAYWMHNTYKTWTWWNSNDAGSNKEGSAYTYANAESEGYLATASSASGNNGYGGKKIHLTRRDSIWFTGATSVACLNKGHSTAIFTMEVFQVASNGTLSKVGSSYTNATTSVTSLVCSSLNASNYYLVKFYATAASNTYLYQVRFGNACADAPSCTTPTTAFANGAYTVGGSALDLSTLISSKQGSGAITYTVKNANGTGATIAGTSFTATSAGTATVTATQAADGDYCEKVMDATITVSAAPAGQTALVINTLYEVPDMIPSGASLTSGDQFMAGLSENTKFEMIGVPASSSTPKVNNDSKNDKTIDGITFDDGSMWFKGEASLTSNIPTTFGLSFIVPEGGGKLYLYFNDSGTSTNIKLAKSGSSGSKPTLTNGFAAVDVTAGTYYLYGTGTTSPYSFYGLKLCSTYAVSFTTTNVTKVTGDATAVQGKAYTATFTAPVGYTLPSDATVSIGGVAQTKGTGYTWTISDGTATLTVPAAKVTGAISITVTGVAAESYSITYHCNGAESGCPSNVAAAYTLPSPLPTGLTKDGYDFGGWFTDSECTVAAVAGAALTASTDLYAKWTERGSGCEDTPHAWDVIATSAKSYKVRISKVTEEVAIPVADATASNLTAYAGSVSTNDNVTVQIADGGSSKYGYKFDGSNTYLKLVFSTPLVLNDTLVVGMTNASHNISFTTTAVRSTTLSTSGGKLIIPAALAGQSTIYLWRGSGSTMYLRSFAVKHECEAIPSCTTPVIPALSNQTVCEGSDIDAWNATPTNASTISDKSESVSYSWKKKGNDTELATTATFDLGASAAESQAGTYVVTVTVSKAGYASASASQEVDLAVTEGTEAPTVTQSTTPVYEGNSVTLTATATTGATYTWHTCNADGTGESSAISGATTNAYTIASAPAAGTHYYKVKVTGDGTHTCGNAETVYALTVSAAAGGDCFHFVSVIPTSDFNASSGASLVTPTHATTLEGGTMKVGSQQVTFTKDYGLKMESSKTVSITLDAALEAGNVVIVKGTSATKGYGITINGVNFYDADNKTFDVSYTVLADDGLEGQTALTVSKYSGSSYLQEVKITGCGESCTDPEVTASADNTTACVGTSVTFTAANAHAEATYQWQKLDGTWTNISGETESTYNIASVVAGDAGKYRVIATHDCSRTSNEVTLSVPTLPDFGSTVPSSVSVMQTIALSINTVEATDAVKYRWYKSADTTWDAGDVEIGTNKELIKAYDSEAIGSPSYYIFCRAQNACGIATSSAIAVNVTAYVEEDCATKGNEGDAEFGFENTGCSQGTYSETAVWTTNSRSKYLTYTAPEGKYLKTAKVTVAVSSGSKCGYAYSTDGGTTWTYAELASLSSTLTEKTINLNSLSGTINAFRISRNLQDGGGTDHGVTSGNFYLSKACFEYTDACTATTVTPSTASVDYEMGGAWSNPTFTLAPAAVSGETLTYSSSNEDIASVDDDGTVTFNGDAGTVTITASYAGGTISETDYCASSGSYTITVSCTGGAPKVVASGTTVGCSSSITLLAKKQDGTAFADGTYQWFRNGEEIDGATSSSYTATQAGTYTVERTNGTGCTTPSTNSAVVTSETTEPEVERLVPFQYYHVDKTYSDQMKMRHLFAVKNSGTLDGKSFKMYVSRSGGAATDVTSSNALVVVPSDDGPVDTVMVDLNKLSGKYSENDELVFTCKAIDCSGNVSETYKSTITMNVIDTDTATLALICSGSSKAGGTRKTSELTVGGDFLTGYNVADLCQQTGNTSFDANTEWGLYTDLKTQYIVTPVNGYAVFNKLNYEPFDILLLTDYPKASKSDAAKDVLDDMAALCDYRPMLSFKTHMVAKSPSKWAAKGFTTSATENKADGRLNLNIVCYAHPMFEGLKSGDDVYTDVGNTSAPLVYTMLTGTGFESSKGMQGFELAAAENFVTIGLTHYNATITKDSPDPGEVEWAPGSEDRMLVTVAERQANPEARFILFSLNCGAQSKLTDKGEEVVLACLNYLLGTAEGTIEPADCSFTFDNGENNEHNAAWYASNCPLCTGTKGDGKWTTAANWGPDYRLLPGEFTSVRIKKPVEVDDTHAHVMEVRIIDEGRIDIPAGKALDVKSTIRRMDGTEIYPTEENELTLEASAESNGTLIFNNKAGDTKATVWAYSKGYIEDGVKNYQYIGTPFKYLNAVYNYYGSWIYSWGIKKNGNWGWVAVKNGGPMSAWTGYCITQESPAYYETSGTMTETGTVDIAVPAGNNMVVGNSWTAPIDINALTTDDLEGLVANIYFFNTGVDKKGTGGAAGSRYVGGTYVTVPVEAARYTGDDDHINSMQGFFVKNTGGSDGTLHLDYDRHVRGTTRGSIIGDALHAPRRANAQSDEPAVLKIKVSGENYDDKLLLLAREDFSMGFDNGWDGDKWDGNESALYIYTKDEEGTENSVSALPEMEGTVIGFRAGEDDAYTLHFEYLNSAEELYLFDTETNAYTKIMTGATYRFFTEDKEKHERFIITRKSPQIATDVDEVDSGKRREVRKLLIEDKMYILVNGMLYDATGKVVK